MLEIYSLHRVWKITLAWCLPCQQHHIEKFDCVKDCPACKETRV
jgi:hypothetical protein